METLIDFNKVSDEKNETINIEIKPQSALSIVGKDYGRYYRNIICPTNNMIFGMLENILGIRIDTNVRSAIKKSIKKSNKVKSFNGNKAFFPVIDEFIDGLEIENIKDYIIFDDLFSSLNNRNDKPHFTGARNVDISYAHKERRDYSKDENDPKLNIPKNVLTEILEKYPEFYTGTSVRELIETKDSYKVSFKTSKYFKDFLLKIFDDKPKVAYIGNSDGVVNVYLN